MNRRGAALLFAILAASPAVAQQQPPASAAPASAGEDMLDPNAPLAPLPDIGVAWPDLAKAPADPDAAQDVAAAAAETRYGYRIEGIDGIGSELLRRRFDELSVLAQHDGEAANTAQLDRRAREDAALLATLLRAEGYYDARVRTNVDRSGTRPVMVLVADPGQLYRLKSITIDGVEQAGRKADALVDAFGVKPDDPVNADTIAAATTRLTGEVGKQGFPFAKVGEPEVTIDHATHTATLDMTIDPGGARRFGRIRVNPDNKVFGAKHVQDIARFQPGEPYSAPGVEDLQRTLIQTGLVASAQVKPVPGETPDTVDLDVTLQPAPFRTIAGELGYGTGEGARAEVSWTHRNFFPPEGAITLRGVLGTQEQLAQFTFRRNNFEGRDRVLTGQISASHTERLAYTADTFSLSGSLERQTNIFFQKAWVWSMGAELVSTDERDVIASTGQPRRRTYYIAALPLSLTYDGSDDLLNPTRGFRLGGRLSPEQRKLG
ncbi:MAG: POTRA domain-containing protein, partial [Sphingomonas bacterium]